MQDEQRSMLSIHLKTFLKKNKKIDFTEFYKKVILIKYIFIIIFIIVFYIHIGYIEIDNEISLYEKNIDYSNFTTDIKAIALYLPQFHSINENDDWWGKDFTEWHNVRKSKSLYKKHYQPRIPGDNLGYLGYYDLSNEKVIMKQVELAKAHGIYGFGVYYYWFSGKRLLEKPLDLFLNSKEIEFKFLLIWANEDWTRRWNGYEGRILIKQQYKVSDPFNFIKDIKKYIIDKRYITINDRSILGLYEPTKIPNLSKIISIWRKEAKILKIGKLYIIACLNNYNYEEMKNTKLFNAVYEFSPRDSLKLFVKDMPYSVYATSLYKKIEFENTDDDFPLYRGSMLEFDNSPRKKEKSLIYENYSPEQFYMINKKIIEWTKNRYNKSNRFIFINAWNEWGEGAYLEPDRKYGYASINSLSKALFELPYKEININFLNFNKEPIIAIQVHFFYDDLIGEIINKTNNIPVLFDLFISAYSLDKKNKIMNYIKHNSKSRNFEVMIVENKGRDIMPFLFQMKYKIKKYKYIGHIHTKKSLFINIGENWRKYLYNNLLGNENIVKEILTDFENNDKLGFIFPENYYKALLLFGEQINRQNKKNMKYLLNKLFHNFKLKIGKKIVFPVGNMFWAKTNAIFQIFNENFENEIPEEFGQNDGTIMHGIERIWLYIVQSNGYYYKTIFKHF